MEWIVVEISRRDEAEGYKRISENDDLTPATCAWTDTNTWESVPFDTKDDDERELEEVTKAELRATLEGLEYTLRMEEDENREGEEL